MTPPRHCPITCPDSSCLRQGHPASGRGSSESENRDARPAESGRPRFVTELVNLVSDSCSS